MKRSLLFAILIAPLLAQAQFLNSMTISPTPTVECSTTVVTLNGTMGCINGIFNGTNLNIVGTTIFVTLDVTQPPICLPAISNITGSVNLTTLTPGTYTVIGQYSENGNVTATLTQSLVVGSCCSVNPGIVNSITTICAGDSITFTAADPTLNSISWKLDGAAIGSSSSVTETFMTPGTYTISMVGDDGSCIDSSAQTITVGDFPTITFMPADEGCPGKADGSIMAMVSSSSPPPVTYSWSNGATSQSLTGISSGTYVLTATSSAGCATTDSATISAGPAVTAAFMASDTLVCAGDTVSFTNMSSGGQANLWYVNGVLSSATPNFQTSLFTNPVNTIKLVSLSATCEDSVELTVELSQKPSIQTTVTKPACPASSDGDITLSITPLHPPYTIAWSGGTSGSTLSQVPGGTYSFTLTDSVGCTFTDSVVVEPDSGIVASFTASDTGIVCLGTTVTLNNTTSGTPSIDWHVNGASVGTMLSQTLDLVDTGTYAIELFVTDGACADTATLTIQVPPLPEIDATVADENCPDADDGEIDLTISQGIAPYQFAWNTGDNSEDLMGIGPGEYQVTVTDAEGCSVMDTFTLVTLGGISADFEFFYGPNGIAFSDLSDSAVSWFWEFGDTNTSTDQNPIHQYQLSGTYFVSLTVIDQYGCTGQIGIFVDFSVGIDDEWIRTITFTPNPTQDVATLDLSDWIGQEVEIQVFDQAGRMLIQEYPTAKVRTHLSLGAFPAGIYLVTVRTEDGFLTGKIRKD